MFLSLLHTWHLVSTSPYMAMTYIASEYCVVLKNRGWWGGEVWVSCPALPRIQWKVELPGQRKHSIKVHLLAQPFIQDHMCAHLRGINHFLHSSCVLHSLYFGKVEFTAFVCDESFSFQPALFSFTSLTGSNCTCVRWTVCRQMFWAVRIQANTRDSGTW